MSRYMQAQAVLDPSAKLISGSGPTSARVGQSVYITVNVQNVGGRGGEIFANLIYGPDVVRTADTYLNSGSVTGFAFNFPMPDASPAAFKVEVGYIQDPNSFTPSYIVTGTSDTFYITKAVFIVDGVVAPQDATDVIVFATFPIPFLTDLNVRIFNAVAPVFLQFTGVTLVGVNSVPDKNEILVWIKSATGGFLPAVGALASALITVMALVIIVVLAWRALDIGKAIVQNQGIVAKTDLLKAANDAEKAVLADPSLTPAEKTAIILKIRSNVDAALKPAIPYNLIIGGAIAVAGLIGVAAVLGSSGGRTFVTERVVAPIRERF